MISGITAVSACISPSIMSPGAFFRTISTALLTFSARGWAVPPKLEKDSIAILGSTSKRLAVSAASRAISARSSESGSMLTVVSARK